jgi:glyoxylase-like metal-dependent hydrolase (beta-lactamase superfamily II)
MKSVFGAFLICLALLVSPFATGQTASGSLDVHWNEGAQDCAKNPQLPLQVHRYNADTFILRESPCATSEAPFMYLLVGAKRALLIDTGDVADPKQMPLAATVMGLLPKGLPLLVVHTHGHMDHRAGDPQFEHLPNVQVVGTDLDHVKAFFDFKQWPDIAAQVDLGGRVVDAVPTPGHYPSEVTYYDRNTALLFTGDFFLPGRLLINDVDADRASAKRIAAFMKDRAVSHVLGGHVELDAHDELFSFTSNYRPNQRALQLSKQDLLALPAMLEGFNGWYGSSGMFVMINQKHELQLLGAAALLVLGAIVPFGVWLVRRIRRRRRARVA